MISGEISPRRSFLLHTDAAEGLRLAPQWPSLRLDCGFHDARRRPLQRHDTYDIIDIFAIIIIAAI